MLELMILAVLGVLGAGVWFLWPIDPDAVADDRPENDTPDSGPAA